jgi:hypothetical protein
MTIASLKMNNSWNRNWNRTNYTDKNSKGQSRLKQQAKASSIGIYFFFAVLVITFALAMVR